MGYLYELFYAVPWLGRLIGLLVFAFQIWMIVDCVRSGNEWYWIWIILFLGPVGALIYFFVCRYRSTGIERSFSKRRIQQRQMEELKSKIHHLDKAYHYAELGDLYRERHEWALAQQAYESALERDDSLFDATVHLGYVLLAQGRAADAWKLLEPAFQHQPSFESGQLIWQCARCQAALGQVQQARQLYERLLENHSYFEAQYEYSELLGRLGDKEACVAAARQLVEDVKHAPRFHQRAGRPWLRKAQHLLRSKGVAA
jgi:hypothetical protein